VKTLERRRLAAERSAEVKMNYINKLTAEFEMKEIEYQEKIKTLEEKIHRQDQIINALRAP